MGTIFLDIYEYILTHMRYTIPGLLETSLKASRSPRQINFIVPLFFFGCSDELCILGIYCKDW